MTRVSSIYSRSFAKAVRLKLCLFASMGMRGIVTRLQVQDCSPIVEVSSTTSLLQASSEHCTARVQYSTVQYSSSILYRIGLQTLVQYLSKFQAVSKKIKKIKKTTVQYVMCHHVFLRVCWRMDCPEIPAATSGRLVGLSGRVVISVNANYSCVLNDVLTQMQNKNS